MWLYLVRLEPNIIVTPQLALLFVVIVVVNVFVVVVAVRVVVVVIADNSVQVV